MENLEQKWIFGTALPAATGPLALAVVLLLAIAATPVAQAQTFHVLYNFTDGRDGGGKFQTGYGDTGH